MVVVLNTAVLSRRQKLAGVLVFGLTLALVACTGREVPVSVAVITTACEAASQPFDGATHLSVRVTADDLPNPIEATTSLGNRAHSVVVPDVPVGNSRVVTVTSHAGDPKAGGRVVALGRSQPFDVPFALSGPPVAVQRSVVVRRVNHWTRVSAAGDRSQCARLDDLRAGHAALLLEGYGVLVSGGYSRQTSSAAPLALNSFLVYRPDTGVFETPNVDGTAAVMPAPVAFHSMSALGDGSVLIWGGSSWAGDGTESSSPDAWRINRNDWSATGVTTLSGTQVMGRSGHLAIRDRSGHVLIAGGYRTIGGVKTAVADIEWFDATLGQRGARAPDQFARVGAVGAAIQEGQFLALAGGLGDADEPTEVSYWTYKNGGFTRERTTSTATLSSPRLGAALARGAQGRDLLLFGGFSSRNQRTTLGTSDVVVGTTNQVRSGPDLPPRADACAVTLPDGRIVVIGGRVAAADGSGTLETTGATVIVTQRSDGSYLATEAATLPVGRYQHSCTALDDNTVLVIGGATQTGGTQEGLADAWVYVPEP